MSGDDKHHLNLTLSKLVIAEWCLNLCLLKEELVEALIYIADKKLKIEIDKRSKREDGPRVYFASDQVRIVAHPEELDWWLSFFLKYYRDGVAPADHIDVQAITTSSPPQEVYVIFKVKDSASPMSLAEARKILDSQDEE